MQFQQLCQVNFRVDKIDNLLYLFKTIINKIIYKFKQRTVTLWFTTIKTVFFLVPIICKPLIYQLVSSQKCTTKSQYNFKNFDLNSIRSQQLLDCNIIFSLPLIINIYLLKSTTFTYVIHAYYVRLKIFLNKLNTLKNIITAS